MDAEYRLLLTGAELLALSNAACLAPTLTDADDMRPLLAALKKVLAVAETLPDTGDV